MSYWVYMLRCKDETLYTGSTDDVARRVEAHNSGRGAKYTRGRGPVAVVYREECADRSAALRREAAIKKLSRPQKWALIRIGTADASLEESKKMEHHEHNHCSCGCGHDHGHDHDHDHPHAPQPHSGELTDNQAAFLRQLHQSHYLPVARFVATSTKETDFSSVALAPVFIRALGDTMDVVKEAGEFLKKLEAQGMLTLDYGMPLKGYGYEEYEQSDLYAYFCQTILQAAVQEDFLSDTPTLELGSMALTDRGEEAIHAVKP